MANHGAAAAVANGKNAAEGAYPSSECEKVCALVKYCAVLVKLRNAFVRSRVSFVMIVISNI